MDVHLSAWLVLFREMFEGVVPGADGTMVVEKSEAIMPILDGLSANEASRNICAGVNSVAGHSHHTTYYVNLLNRVVAGDEVRPDWTASWGQENVNEEEWSVMRDRLRHEYQLLLSHVDSGRLVPDNELHAAYLWGQVAHAAFHLGSIRQIVWIMRSDS
ncbi:MAG: hypothetical protein KF812_03395 [Fimbriimonadaceae bacterium]|nr:hypothetical protein [Fimbriimonadaceae bacterium]